MSVPPNQGQYPGGYPPPPNYSQPGYRPQAGPVRPSSGTLPLVLGIIALVCCQLCGPVAWFLGRKELKAIRAGEATPEAQGTAMTGMILGIVATILGIVGFIVTVLYLVVFGGLAALSSMQG